MTRITNKVIKVKISYKTVRFARFEPNASGSILSKLSPCTYLFALEKKIMNKDENGYGNYFLFTMEGWYRMLMKKN